MRRTAWLLVGGLVAGIVLALPALAQSPFGVAAPPPAPDGLAGFILAKQAEFYRLLTGAVRAAKQDGSALYLLGGISFAYGIFHAAGPGHGKAVISSYLLANEASLKRGIGLAFASALAQSLTAILVAGIFAVVLGATAATMQRAVFLIEIAAYGLIVLLGTRLAYVKARALVRAWRGEPDHVHAAGEACEDGHAHLPGPAALPRGGLREWWAAVLSVGLRPCSGAILVLVFSLTQGIFWVGAASTALMGVGTAITVSAVAAIAVFAKHLAVRLAAKREGNGIAVALRAVELAAALALVAFGLALLFGFMASERLGLG
ncbi:nickel/cobalt transporter [Ancylobacter defluvii]|uniref:Nickel/cobalt efflux system n=1 Tax=Ancylobacter defluvii TaxID=1282440 RepID=A0A9W6JRQ6_9HYPH|nr:nickel/cobalt transporter [Ancylobacter defluvii]MBS7587362.1 nickel/cobalt transporter [Ancylobacter defluvii]GLK82052.1 nickel/cobalt efflux system [Ancylobacter defluvii]